MRLLILLLLFGIIITVAGGCVPQSSVPSPGKEPGSPSSSSLTMEKKATLSYPIVDTGQVKCYDNRKEISCPVQGKPFYGQDAQYQGNQPSYTLSTDGLTVYDNVTGLTWQRSPDTDGDGSITSSDKLTWAQAQAHPAILNGTSYGGFNDWRLPTIKELYSLIQFNGTDPRLTDDNTSSLIPFIDTNYFKFAYGQTNAGERVIDSQYASSTLDVDRGWNGDKLFGVNFADGRIKGYGLTMPGMNSLPSADGRPGEKIIPRTTSRPPLGDMPGQVRLPSTGGSREKTFFVQCVRGNTDYGHNAFVNNGDGTITDLATGLMWSKADSGRGMNWEEALTWVQQKNKENYLGHDDWRLPNAKELQSIVDYTRSPGITSSAAIDPLFTCTQIKNEAGQVDYPFYWTGTTHVSSGMAGAAAVYIAFGRATGYMNGQWQDVHGAGAQRSDPKEGNPVDYQQGRGPQGDSVRINNYVRCVRNADPVTESTHEPAPSLAAPVNLNTEACQGYTLYSSPQSNTILIDMSGSIVKEWSISGMPAKMLPEGTLLGSKRMRQSGQQQVRQKPGMKTQAPYQDTIEFIQLAWNGAEEWLFAGWDDDGTGVMMSRQHHDYQRQGNPVGYYAPGQEFAKNGTTLILAHKNKLVPEISDKELQDDVIYEVNWSGKLTGFEWHAADHFNEFGFDQAAKDALYRAPQYDEDKGFFDWLHINSMSLLGENRWYTASGDERFNPANIIISSRSASFIAIISRIDGSIVWRIGPDFSTGKPENGLGQLVGPHHAHMIPAGLPGAGNILVFDNGGQSGYGGIGDTPRYTRSHSRVVEFNPSTLEVVWQYGAEAGEQYFFSRDISSAQRLPNGNTLITDGRKGRIFEVTRDKQVVWEFIAPAQGRQDNSIYRAYRIPPEWVPGNPAHYVDWAILYEQKNKSISTKW